MNIFFHLLHILKAKFGASELLRNANFRLYWFSAALGGLGEQVSNLAIPLTAAILLHASPSQMGLLVGLEMLPFAIFSLPSGVWIERNRKLPMLIKFEALAGIALISIPLAYAMGWLGMPWLYCVAFVTGICHTVGGSCAQISMAFLVKRENIYAAQAKFALTDSANRLMGPGFAGVLVQWLSAPIALIFNGLAFLISVFALLRIKIVEPTPVPSKQHPLQDILEGLRFVRRHPVLWPLAWSTAIWQLFFNGYQALQILFATRIIGLSPSLLGTAQMMGGVGVLVSSALLKPMTARFGAGNTIMIGMSTTAVSWILLANVPANFFGSAVFSAIAYGSVIFLLDCGLMLYFMPYLAMRLKVTPDDFLGRMISTMRFLTVAAAPCGAFFAGWLGEHLGLRFAMIGIAIGAMMLSVLVYFASPLQKVRE